MKTPPHAVLAYLRSLVHSHADAASDDRELLRRFGERRDDAAFAVLLERHGPMVLNSARRLTGDEQLAEDVFQATFLLLSRKAHTIRRAEALPCWLHSVARRLAVQARRARTRRRERETRVQPQTSRDPLEELSACELVAVLDEEIGRLPESQRAVVILCCLEGLSQEEAARRLGCSVAAVKGRLERGRQRLRLRLEKRGLTLPAVLGGTVLLAGATSPVTTALADYVAGGDSRRQPLRGGHGFAWGGHADAVRQQVQSHRCRRVVARRDRHGRRHDEPWPTSRAGERAVSGE